MYSSPAGWNSIDKFRAVLEAASLSEIEVFEYCREKGIYLEQIQDWKSACEKINNWDNYLDKHRKENIQFKGIGW